MTALSIRQPWAYLIVHACKDIENRDWPTRVRGRVLIHAGKTMTRADYDSCVLFCGNLPDGTMPNDFSFPMFDALKGMCGGVVGVMTIGDCVPKSPSPWFVGRYGFVIESAAEKDFKPCNGQLGFFQLDE